MIAAIIISTVTAVLVFHLGKFPKIGVIRSSTIVTIVFYFIFKSYVDPAIIYGASFVGMCSSLRFNYIHVVIAGVTYPFVLNAALNLNYPLGGTLGFCAFICVCLVYGLQNLKIAISK